VEKSNGVAFGQQGPGLKIEGVAESPTGQRQLCSKHALVCWGCPPFPLLLHVRFWPRAHHKNASFFVFWALRPGLGHPSTQGGRGRVLCQKTGPGAPLSVNILLSSRNFLIFWAKTGKKYENPLVAAGPRKSAPLPPRRARVGINSPYSGPGSQIWRGAGTGPSIGWPWSPKPGSHTAWGTLTSHPHHATCTSCVYTGCLCQVPLGGAMDLQNTTSLMCACTNTGCYGWKVPRVHETPKLNDTMPINT